MRWRKRSRTQMQPQSRRSPAGAPALVRAAAARAGVALCHGQMAGMQGHITLAALAALQPQRRSPHQGLPLQASCSGPSQLSMAPHVHQPSLYRAVCVCSSSVLPSSWPHAHASITVRRRRDPREICQFLADLGIDVEPAELGRRADAVPSEDAAALASLYMSYDDTSNTCATLRLSPYWTAAARCAQACRQAAVAQRQLALNSVQPKCAAQGAARMQLGRRCLNLSSAGCSSGRHAPH